MFGNSVAEKIQEKLVSTYSSESGFINKALKKYAFYIHMAGQTYGQKVEANAEYLTLAKFVSEFAYLHKDDPSLELTDEEKEEVNYLLAHIHERFEGKKKQIETELGKEEAEDFEKVMIAAPLIYASIYKEKDSFDDFHFNRNMNALYGLKLAKGDLEKERSAFTVGGMRMYAQERLTIDEIDAALNKIDSYPLLKGYPMPENLEEHQQAFERLLEFHSIGADYDSLSPENFDEIKQAMGEVFEPEKVEEYSKLLEHIHSGELKNLNLYEKRRAAAQISEIYHKVLIDNEIKPLIIRKLQYDLDKVKDGTHTKKGYNDDGLFTRKEHKEEITGDFRVKNRIKALENHYEKVVYPKQIRDYNSEIAVASSRVRKMIMNEQAVDELDKYFKLKKKFHQQFDAAFFHDVDKLDNVKAMLEYLDLLESKLSYTQRVLDGKYEEQDKKRQEEQSKTRWDYFDDDEEEQEVKTRKAVFEQRIKDNYDVEKIFYPDKDIGEGNSEQQYEMFKTELNELVLEISHHKQTNGFELGSEIIFKKPPRKLCKQGSQYKVDETKLPELIDNLNQLKTIQNVGLYADIPFPAARYALDKGKLKIEIAKISGDSLPALVEKLPGGRVAAEEDVNKKAQKTAEEYIKAKFRGNVEFEKSSKIQK